MIRHVMGMRLDRRPGAIVSDRNRLAASDIAAALKNETLHSTIEQSEAQAEQLGIHGVPAFVYNGRMLFSGAQSAETIALALKRAAAKGL